MLVEPFDTLEIEIKYKAKTAISNCWTNESILNVLASTEEFFKSWFVNFSASGSWAILTSNLGVFLMVNVFRNQIKNFPVIHCLIEGGSKIKQWIVNCSFNVGDLLLPEALYY